ncbi:hypothetical protein [Desulfomonile tiedjei]|uniref:Uncharacterized protein n=1 Tax=Desulfomonile tiedjei (strain ATCC 49306 / DSM 6799 / DCB-1) TaxID=706587 RepID=I4C4J1_DESTA|nr:hypothetical protein [Desulfomonile tiedjei]AFM24482.1 hypothetical protein Desti_1772 [Desulfomonile tiedjei DSM 6799]
MGYLVVPLISILLFASAPDLAGAQGLYSPSGVGFSALSGFGNSDGCTHSDPRLSGGMTFNMGYLATNRGAVFELTADPLVGTVSSVRHDYPIDGLWLALSASGQIGDGVGIYARGSWLVPSNRQSSRTLVFGGNPEPGTWRTKVQWYNADIAGTCSTSGTLTVIGGFRFDSFEIKFHDRDLVDPDDLATDETNVTIMSYIPYAGVMLNSGSALKLGLIGFPYVPGNVEYDHTWGTAVIRHDGKGSFGNSVFLEAFGEYGRQLMGGHVGIFGIWTYLHGSSSLDVTRTIGGGAPTPGRYRFSTDRQNWIIGGQFAMNFTSPM